MKLNIIEIKTTNELIENLPNITSLNIVAIDTETTGLDPYSCSPILFQIGDENVQYVVHCYKVSLEPLRDFLENSRCIKCFHNHKFDYKILKHFFSIEVDKYVHDTMLAEILIQGGNSNAKIHSSLSLGGLSEIYLNYKLDKTTRGSFEHWRPGMPITKRQIEYSTEDILVTVKIAKLQLEKTKEKGLEFVNNLEAELSAVIGDIELNGMYLDQSKWLSLHKQTEEKLLETKKELDRYFEKYCDTDLFGNVIVNYDANGQLLEALRRSGINIENTEKETLKKIETEYNIIPVIQKYREYAKAISTYGEGFLQFINPVTQRLHSDYWLMVDTGRLCIAKGTYIDMPCNRELYPKGVPIENIKTGDYIYCYDDILKLRLKRVKWAGKTGHKKVLRIHWLGQGRKYSGYLDVTPEHKVRLYDGTYVEAKNLKKNDRILSLGRRTINKNRSTLYPKGKSVIEHRFIFEELYNCKPDCVHHVDHNSLNNEISNLQEMSISEHSRYHTLLRMKTDEFRDSQLRGIMNAHKNRVDYPSGEDAHNYIKVSRFALLRELAKNGFKPTKCKNIVRDFDTLRKKCRLHSIDINEISKRYDRDGNYIWKGELKKTLGMKQPDCYASVKVGYYRYYELLSFYGLANHNHIVTKIEYLDDPVDVYDIEVDEHHNFIANELCVHNSSKSPNLQNVKAPRSKDDLNYREPFTAQNPFDDILTIDYAGCELRVLAQLSQDPVMVKAFQEELVTGKEADIHSKVASLMFGVEVSKKVNSDLRSKTKNLNFGLIYGMGTYRLSLNLGVPLKEGKDIIKRYFKTMPKVKDYLEDAGRKVLDLGYTKTLSGRIRSFNIPEYGKFINEYEPTPTELSRYGTRTAAADNKYNAIIAHITNCGKNTPIQGTNGDIVKLALVNLRKDIKQNNRTVKIVNTVHDEIVFEGSNLSEYLPVAKQIMEDAEAYFLTDIPPRVDATLSYCWSK